MPPRSAVPVGWALSLLCQFSTANRLALPIAYGDVVLLHPVGSAGWSAMLPFAAPPAAIDNDVACPLARPKSLALAPLIARPVMDRVPVPVLVKVKDLAAGLVNPRTLENASRGALRASVVESSELTLSAPVPPPPPETATASTKSIFVLAPPVGSSTSCPLVNVTVLVWVENGAAVVGT